MTTSNYSLRLDELYAILKEAEQFGLNFSQLLAKINELKKSSDDSTIRIVLISSFSDGKTSTIAGLLGKVEENMKIDSDESSDEIVIYHPKGLKHGFEIVDTPGLFGTKEKEINGESVRFSEITEKYISQAHLILYICDAVTPLKESHAYVISKLMRDFDKLDSTIFVINKMDEAGYDPLDATDFTRGIQIKTENLKKRLRDTIALTSDEENKLHIVCICADPKGKGISYWLENKPQGYKERSHIDTLQKEIKEIIEEIDVPHVLTTTNQNTIVDLTQQAVELIQKAKNNLDETVMAIEEKGDKLSTDLALLRKDLMLAKNDMEQQLDDLENQLIADVNSATPQTIKDLVECQLGTNSKGITFDKLERKINHIVSTCAETNNVYISTHLQGIEKNISIQDELLTEGLHKGAKIASEFLKNTKLTGETVKVVRDLIASSYKFKPWGAIKVASKFNKAMPWVGAGIDVGMSIWETIKEKKQQREFEEMKGKIKDAFKEIIKEVINSFKIDEDYFRNYAPSYLQLKKQLEERQSEASNLRKIADNFQQTQTKLSSWLKEQAEDVEYEVIAK